MPRGNYHPVHRVRVRRSYSTEIDTQQYKRDESGRDFSTEMILPSVLTHVRTRAGLSEDAKDSGLTPILVLLCFRCCFNRQRLSRVAEGTGPLKPQQPGATAKVLIPAQVGRDKILD